MSKKTRASGLQKRLSDSEEPAPLPVGRDLAGEAVVAEAQIELVEERVVDVPG